MRVVRKSEALAKLGISESTFDSRRRTDPRFPRAVVLGARAIGFVEGELDEYIANLPRLDADLATPSGVDAR